MSNLIISEPDADIRRAIIASCGNCGEEEVLESQTDEDAQKELVSMGYKQIETEFEIFSCTCPACVELFQKYKGE